MFAMHENCIWQVVDETFITCRGTGQWSPKNFDQWCTDLQAAPVLHYITAVVGVFEVTSAQRRRGAKIIKDKKMSIIVITDENKHRGFVTALSWLGVQGDSFPWSQFSQAIDKLRLPAQKSARVSDAIRDMCARLRGAHKVVASK